VRNKTILILGGTRHALDLASQLCRLRNYRVITSLAGRTKSPTIPDGEVRMGGFGGIPAMVEYLEKESVDIVADATHPFATTISSNAAQAVTTAGISRIMLQRAPWQPIEGDHWEEFPDLETAASNLAAKSRCFLTIGRQELGCFNQCKDIWFLVRMIDEPEGALPLSHYEVVTGLPMADATGEKTLMQTHRIDTLITKNSGGKRSAAKLKAARELNIRVMMINRPATPEGTAVTTVDSVVEWIKNHE